MTPGIASDLAERLWLAELWLLEKWEMIGLDENGDMPDVHTDQEKKAMDRFAALRAHVDTVPASQLSKAEQLRARLPHVFEKVSCHFASVVGFGYYPESAAEFVHSLIEEVERIESYLAAAAATAHTSH